MAHPDHDEAFYTRELQEIFGSAVTPGRDLTWYYATPPGPQLAVNANETAQAGKSPGTGLDHALTASDASSQPIDKGFDEALQRDVEREANIVQVPIACIRCASTMRRCTIDITDPQNILCMPCTDAQEQCISSIRTSGDTQYEDRIIMILQAMGYAISPALRALPIFQPAAALFDRSSSSANTRRNA